MRTVEMMLDQHYSQIMAAAERLLEGARTAGNTTLSSAASPGATHLSVTSIAEFAVSDVVMVGTGSGSEIHRVIAVDGVGLRLTLGTTLRAEHAPGEPVRGALQDVRGIIRGDRADAGQLKTPLLWLMEGVDRIEISGGSSTVHKFEIVVAALVLDKDPAAGRAAAADLAGRAYQVILTDRTLESSVHQVVPVRFEPAQRMPGNNQAFWAAAMFNAQVRRRD